MRRARSSAQFTPSDYARYRFSDELKDWVSNMAPDLDATLWADLLGAALSDVDWDEISDSWLAEIKGYVRRRGGGDAT